MRRVPSGSRQRSTSDHRRSCTQQDGGRSNPVAVFLWAADAARSAPVEPDPARAEGRDLQQTAYHSEVLQEVDELVPIGEMGVKGERVNQHAPGSGKDMSGLVASEITRAGYPESPDNVVPFIR
jgi:hypothetical protein